MNILLCSPSEGKIGGISLWTKHILNYFGNSTNENNLDFVDCGRKSNIEPTTKILYRGTRGIKEYYFILSEIKKKLKQKEYDLLHLASSASISLVKDYLILKWAKKKKINTVIHFHFGRIPQIFQEKKWEYRLMIKVLNKADHIIVIDPNSFQTLKKEGFSNVTFLPNPLSPSVINYIKSNTAIERKPNKILFAGHVIPSKGIFELITATKEIDDIKIHFIGSISKEVKMEIDQLISQDVDKYIILGEQNHETVIKEMLSAKIFILPSYTEGFPNVILESMASGCCIIATNVGALPNMLDTDSDEHCGILVKPKDSEQIKNAILQILNNVEDSNQYSFNAIKKVNDKYNIQSIAKQLIAIWKITKTQI